MFLVPYHAVFQNLILQLRAGFVGLYILSRWIWIIKYSRDTDIFFFIFILKAVSYLIFEIIIYKHFFYFILSKFLSNRYKCVFLSQFTTIDYGIKYIYDIHVYDWCIFTMHIYFLIWTLSILNKTYFTLSFVNLSS